MNLNFDFERKTTTPTVYQVCKACGKRKAQTGFKTVYRTGKRDETCRVCREAAAKKRTPLHVQRASAMGTGVEGRWAADRCQTCGEKLCWDTDGRGNLVALDRGSREVHRHQPERQSLHAPRSAY